MGLFDILIGAAILNDLSKKHEKKSSDSIFGGSTYNRGYSDGDGYDDAWHDREFDNECDCGYCSDHDEDGW